MSANTLRRNYRAEGERMPGKKTKSRKQRAMKVQRWQPRVAIGGAVITCVAGLFMILAYSGALNGASGGKNSRAQITTQTISTQSFNSTTPSKEYIYAGSRLVATEEAGSNNHGSATIGIYNSAYAAFFLRNSNVGGVADIYFNYGPPNLVPLVGDWNGDGVDTVGLYDPAHAAFFLRNTNSGGVADITFTFGPAGLGLIPIVGDWDKDGVDTIGVYDPGHAGFFLRNTNTGGIADLSFTYGPVGSGIVPLAGNWDGQ